MAHLASGFGHFMSHDMFKPVFTLVPMTKESSLSTPYTIFEQHTARKKSAIPLLCILVLLHICAMFQSPEPAIGQPPMADGIQPLIQLEGRPLHQLIPLNIRPLLLPKEQEQFLHELEGLPPDWHALQKLDHTQQSERLFQLNRERDEARFLHKDILQHSIAFVWSGLLRQYLPEYQGFSVALGPELTSTSWGIVRFKPMGLPDYLVAIPSLESARQLLIQQQRGEQIEIIVLFLGTLVTDESLIYGFSHDDKKDGMILPVVQIEGVKYFLKSS